MSILDITDVDVIIEDRTVSGPTLQNTLIFDPDTDESSTYTIDNLSQRFVSLSDFTTVFPNTTKLYKAADAHYRQPGHQSDLKVGRVTSTDANITASLDALFDEDKDWFCLITTSKVEADLIEMGDWAASKDIIFKASVEFDTTKLNAELATDIAKVQAAKSNNNNAIMCHHQAGVDSTSAAIVITSEVATVTQVAHGLRVFDPITLATSTEPLANGNHTVATVVDADNFTYTVAGAADLSSEAITYFARYLFIESALQSAFFSGPVGTNKAAYLNLVGQTAIPKTILTDSQIQTLRDKRYIVYSEPYNNISITLDGFMVTGRQIKDEAVAVWVDLNMEAGIFNIQVNKSIAFTNEGATQIRNGITGALDIQLARGGMNPLNDIVPYIVDIPDALSATSANRQAGIYPAITVTGRIGSEILKIKVNVTLLV